MDTITDTQDTMNCLSRIGILPYCANIREKFKGDI